MTPHKTISIKKNKKQKQTSIIVEINRCFRKRTFECRKIKETQSSVVDGCDMFAKLCRKSTRRMRIEDLFDCESLAVKAPSSALGERRCFSRRVDHNVERVSVRHAVVLDCV